jgi:hypothetical protein
MTRFCLVAAAAISITFALSGCLTPVAVLEAPRGFAVFERETPFRAITPEGLVLRARTAKNEPPQDLTFWSQALALQMEQSGYIRAAEGSFSALVGNGAFYEWVAPVGRQDWVYLTAIAVDEKTIVIVEAAAPAEHYAKHRAAIRESLGSLAVE